MSNSKPKKTVPNNPPDPSKGPGDSSASNEARKCFVLEKSFGLIEGRKHTALKAGAEFFPDEKEDARVISLLIKQGANLVEQN